ncbi:hypothetical protein HK099_008010, partial [Clydaea vesicula]
RNQSVFHELKKQDQKTNCKEKDSRTGSKQSFAVQRIVRNEGGKDDEDQFKGIVDS